MSVFNYKKYKVSLNHDSKKTQGLRTGDIVRRQYFDGKNIIYSLMCVISYGTEEVLIEGEIVNVPYFIGALLEGDEPKSEEILDFMRITSLFDTDRLGALYLTASDQAAPYMDIIDGIGRNSSLCWPESIAGRDYQDSEKQYVIRGSEYVSTDYVSRHLEYSRICHFKKNAVSTSGFIGIQQDFYQYVANPNRVLVSYRIKSSRNLENVKVSLEYINGGRVDGEVSVKTTTEWAYKFHAITVDWSGRHLRTLKLNLNDSLVNGDEIWISDLNIILNSSVSNYQDASQTRIGKMDGIYDPVFGHLDGYGGYLQRLYASGSAHVSGTLTAGDENGFGSTFYAGKIHRNAFVNSLEPAVSPLIVPDIVMVKPTGIGNVYGFASRIDLNAQTASWRSARIGKKYCFSFWAYAKNPCVISMLQNGKLIDTISVEYAETHKWSRKKVAFEIQDVENVGEALYLSFVPVFSSPSELSENIGVFVDEDMLYFSAPQLEVGDSATQYQPTDQILNFTEDYGAWFNRGGIGGTIQNPLLQLNYDGNGSIGTRTKSFLLKVDGSGYFANKNISWDKAGKVTFGEDVTLNWNNLSNETKDALSSKSVKLIGPSAITANKQSDGTIEHVPDSVLIEVTTIGIDPSRSTYKWHYLKKDGSFSVLSGFEAKTATIQSTGYYWDGQLTCTLKCTVTFENVDYVDTFAIQKNVVEMYSVKITSTSGSLFKNGACSTKLKGNVYRYQELMSDTWVANNILFNWKKYNKEMVEIANWGNVDPTKQEIDLNQNLFEIETIDCLISLKG